LISDPKKILIICFSFPPFPGVGGRRWAKFAKYLAKKDFNLFVISAKNENENVSEWNSDVNNAKNISVFEIPLGYSKVLSQNPKNIAQKIIYKLLWKALPFLVKGNPQDKLFFIRNKFLAKAKYLIKKENIKTAIVTIPPYKLAWYMLELKREFPDVRFITDYRDPWTDNKSYHGFDNLDYKRLAAEEQFEKEVLEKSDLILNVHLQSIEDLKLRINENSKFRHLNNGFDKDDYLNIKITKADRSKIRFIYSGSFYPNLIYIFEPFLNCLDRLKTSHPHIYSKLEFNFYGGMDHNAIELLNKKNIDIVKHHGGTDKANVLNKISDSDYCLMFTAPDYSFAFNTKFFDYLYLRKPFIYFGHEGKVSEYISNNNIGEIFPHDLIEDKWYLFLTDIDSKIKPYNTNLDISEFELADLTQKLIKIMNE
jgi:hypothetical protein